MYRALRDKLNEEQSRLLFEIDFHSGDSWMAEQDRFVDELCRHLPGLAPAIRAVAWHHLDQQCKADVGRCCASEAGEREDLAGEGSGRIGRT